MLNRNEMVSDMDETSSVKTTVTETAGMMETEEDKRTQRTVISISRSLLLSFISGLMYSLVGAVVKHMTNIHPAQLLCYRFCIVTSMCLPQIVWNNENILGPPGSRKVIYLRSITASVAGLLQFIAFRHLPLGEAAVIVSSYPAFVTIVAKIFLNESFGLLQVISIVLTTIGMFLVTGLYERLINGSVVYTADNIYGLAAVLAAVLCVTLYYVLTRKSKHVHYSLLLFISGIPTIIECVVVVLVVDKFRLVYRGLQQFFL